VTGARSNWRHPKRSFGFEAWLRPKANVRESLFTPYGHTHSNRWSLSLCHAVVAQLKGDTCTASWARARRGRNGSAIRWRSRKPAAPEPKLISTNS
jgi:hypothetical protein